MAVILHLSDIQFGVHHRFEGCDPAAARKETFTNERYGTNKGFRTLFAKLEEDLQVLYEGDESLRANILVISGDLAEWSLEDEYKEVHTFVSSLIDSEYTDLTRDRVILVPGNHDVNWDLSESFFSECKAYKKVPTAPYSKKYGLWYRFLQEFYGKDVASEMPWRGFDLSEYGILAIALDSCIQESHRREDHYGWLGIEQVKEASAWLKERDAAHQHVHLAVFHHNAIRASNSDDENLRDWDQVRRYFDKNVDLILHGHRHIDYKSGLTNLNGHGLVILAAGSAGLDQRTLLSTPNQYQLIRIDGQNGEVYLRSYSEHAVGFTGQGKFRADADENGKWKYPFTLGASVSVPSVSTRHDASLFSRYVKLSLEEIDQRVAKEEGKIGQLLPLECVNIRSNQVCPLDSLFSTWMDCDQNRLVLLGAAGSGKTVSCLSLIMQAANDTSLGPWTPVYIDLSKFAVYDDIIDIFVESFRRQGIVITKQQALYFIESHNLLICLDAFDEYEKRDFVSASDRCFTGFQHLNRPSIKVLLTCRSNFFRYPQDIFIYNVRSREFEMCPTNSLVVELMPLKPSAVATVLSEYVPANKVPEWIYELTDRPLYLRMLLALLLTNAIELTQKLKRHELYERFITYVLSYDMRRTQSGTVSLDQSRRFHVKLAERFLERHSASLANAELLHLIESVFVCNRADDRFGALCFFFQHSGLLKFDGGQLVFAHKSYREYLVARSIYDLIAVGDDDFAFTWFTRNEREFIVEMLSDPDKDTLCRWLSNEEKGPACNYASFILGATGDSEMIPPLLDRLRQTKDALLKVNCANSLAALGSKDIENDLTGIIVGYLLMESIIAVVPAGCSDDALKWISSLNQQFRRPVMLLHLCESVDALARVGDIACLEVLKILENAPDKTVVEEARGAIRRLVDRLAQDDKSRSTTGGQGTVQPK